ncbi:MFS transporter [Aestuariivita boseongensis]|uniref:MFS transporter n=1 Tax=Aestuariivita boseongensis TaxID=1470562 RepID=UPI000682E86C|nr:MFS transporter [Aestuariivita boseongensis]
MKAGLIMLCLAYVLSQFFRAFLAVLASVLETDIGATAEDLAFASGLWFLVFAVMQLPVGWALDHIGPRRTAATLLAIGAGGGSLLFALATAPWQIAAAMGLIGLGCSPALMASYFIFAREFPPAKFATLAALMLGVASLGNLLASYPTALASDTIGWRATLGTLSGLSFAIALGIFLTVRDPRHLGGETKGSLLDILKMPVVWPIFALMLVNYAPTGAIRGLWIGPYLTDVYGLSATQVGQATLAMAVAMILGTFAFGPLDRLLGTRKWVILTGNLICGLSVLTLAIFIESGVLAAVVLLALAGFTGATYPIIIAHARAFFPPHLTGRGVTLTNLCAMGGIGVMQSFSGRLHTQYQGAEASLPYQMIFGFFAVSLLVGVAIYLFSRDSVD